jgi:hypothetical protein
MNDGTNKIKKAKSNEFKHTLDYIFNIDQKEVFDNELNCLKEEIEINNLNLLKIPAIMNFVIYKTNELNFHSKLAESLKNSSKNSVIEDYLAKENFSRTSKHIANNVRNNNMTIMANVDSVKEKKSDVKIQEENITNNCENEVDSFFIFDSNNLNQDEGHFFTNNNNDRHNNYVKTSDPNFSLINSGSDVQLHNIEKIENSLVNNCNFNQQIEFNNKNPNFECLNCNSNYVDKTKSTLINIPYKKKIVYKFKIFYLDGSDNSAQLCNVEIDENVDFSTFVLQLKKQLGIYEYAKFKIVLLDKSSYHQKYLKDLSQLKTNEVNEIKIIPI